MELLIDETYLKFQNSCSKEVFLEELEKLKNELKINTTFSNFFNTCLEKYCILRTSENFFYFISLSEEEKKLIKDIYNLSKIRVNLLLESPLFLRFDDSSLSNNLRRISVNYISKFELSIGKEKKIRYSIQDSMINCSYIFESDYLIRKVFYPRGKLVSKNMDLKDFISRINYDHFTIEMLKAHLEYLSNKNLLVRDLKKDFDDNPYSLYVPIAFELLEKAKNKKHLLEMKFEKDKKFKSFNRFNKMSLNNSYSVIKCQKDVMENERAKLFETEDNDFKSVEKDRKSSYFLNYFNKKIEDIEDVDKHILDDYLNMSFYLKERINLKIDTSSKLRKAHDKISERYVEKQIKEGKRANTIKLKPTNPFLKLKFPKEFKMLKTSKDFFEEGTRNKNCVFSYIPSVNKEKCVIYTLTKDGSRYTIEIQKDKEFFLAQIKGFANSKPSDDIIDYVKDKIEQNNKRLFKKR